MLACVDVHYEPAAAVTACVGFLQRSDAAPALERVARIESAPQPYEPGRFYERELPYLLDVVQTVRRAHALETIVIDGHVWLAAGVPGLGAHLFEALRGEVVIVGIAKNEFEGGVAIAVLRGRSRQPLYVTAAGMDPIEAAQLTRDMHGPHRIPTMCKRVDQLARGHLRASPT